MLYRELGKTKEQVSLLGFGCMRFPQIEGRINEDEASKMLKYAIDNGVNYLDTAHPYHNGQSEPFVGKFLKENNLRDKVKLATKLPSWLIKSKEDMHNYFNNQLEKLQTDYIDFYLVHNLTKEYWENLLNNDLFEFLDEIKESKKVKHIGFSFHDKLELFKEIVDSYDWEFAQIQYNYLDEEYQAGTEGMQYASEKGLGVIIMEPLRGGKLANKMSDELLDIIKEHKVEKNPVDLAFKFIFDKEEVGLVLSGMSTIEQVKDNLRIVDESGESNSLTENESATIEKLCKAMKEKIKISCTDCKYCIPCPVGVNIPLCFELYNDATMFNDSEGAKTAYINFVKGNNAQASKCVQCGSCEEACPQNIEIIKNLEIVKNAFED